jgi:Coenzyme PQQ synthesis protein D (PqqD)
MDGEYLIYSPEASKALFLNSSAALIWNLCDGQRTVQEIVELLADNYPGIDMDAEVRTAIDRLCLEGVLQLDEPNPSSTKA